MAKAEDVKDWKQFDDYISFQVIPVRIGGGKEAAGAAWIGIVEDIGEIFDRVATQ